MGSFEKLGILVIVVIIVMILAVAIYQWGGAGVQPGVSVAGGGGALPLVVKPKEKNYLDERDEQKARAEQPDHSPAADADSWPGGIPRKYVIKPGDSLWVVVVKRWKLKEGFVDAIARENPKLAMKKLRPGKEVRIPNPHAYWPGRKTAPPAGNLRTYEVAEGDLLGTIARDHLGSPLRWQDIVDVNPGLNPNKLRPGQRINLPAR